MKNLTFVFMAVATMTSVGCKKKGGGSEAMSKMTEFKDQMCACKDAKCAQGVQEQMTKWSQENAKNTGDKKPEPMSEEDTKKYSEATTKFSDCAQKAMSAGGDMAGSGSATAAGSGSAAAAGSGSATAEGSGSAAGAAPASCPAGLAASPDNTFCIKVPATLKAGKPFEKDKHSMSTDFLDDAGNGATVVVTKFEDDTDFDDEVKSRVEESKKKEYKNVKVEDLSDGKFISWDEPDGKTWITALHRKGKDMKFVFCRANGKPVDPATVEACKTLSPL